MFHCCRPRAPGPCRGLPSLASASYGLPGKRVLDGFAPDGGVRSIRVFPYVGRCRRGRWEVRRLAGTDVSRLLEFLRASYGTLDGHAFRAHVLAGLRRLIPCDIIAYNEVNPRTNEIAWMSD